MFRFFTSFFLLSAFLPTAGSASTAITPQVECPTVILNFTFNAADGQKVTDAVQLVVPPQRNPRMLLSLAVLSAGRTIQILTAEWHSEAKNPSIAPPLALPVARAFSYDGLSWPAPLATDESPASKQPTETRGQRFAKALRAYAANLQTQAALQLPRMQDDAHALTRQFYQLNLDLNALAAQFEAAEEYHSFREGPRRQGSMLDRLGGGATFGNSRNESMVFSLAAVKGTLLTSGGTMSDVAFWEKVRSGEIPHSQDFNFDGYLKRFRIASSNYVTPASGATPVAVAVGDVLYYPEAGRMLLQVGMVTPLQEKDFVRPALKLVLALDKSGSMETNDGVSKASRLAGAKLALNDVVGKLREGDTVAIFAFDDAIEPVVGPTVVTALNRAEILAAIDKIKSGGSTNIGLAQEHGYKLLDQMTFMPGAAANAQSRLVLITDAMVTQGEMNEKALGNLARARISDRLYTTVIGVGRGFSRTVSEELASSEGGMFFFAGNGDELYKLFSHFDTRMVTFGTNFRASVAVQGFPGRARVVAIHGSGVTDARNTSRIGQFLDGTPVLNVPTLMFADFQEVDPNAGGGALQVELQFEPITP